MRRSWTILFVLLSLVGSVWSQVTPETTSLEFGQSIEKEIKPQEKHSYKVHLKAGQFAKLEVTEKGCDIVLLIVNAEGKNLIEIGNRAEGTGIEATSFAVETTGDYEL